MQKRRIFGKLIALIFIVVLISIIVKIYKINNYNEYIRAEYNIGVSEFARDGEVKYSNNYSYKINNVEYNDAMFYKTIEVTPNTPYRVTCMVKTQDVISQNDTLDAGAHICVGDTIEKSNNILGTTDWTQIEFMFNSKDRTQVDVGFRLGGYKDIVKGTAWFADMKIESGIVDESTQWNYLCLVFNNIDVNVSINGVNQNIKLELTQSDKYDLTTSYSRFKNSLEELSKGKITANIEMLEIEEPIKSMSYDDENGYYISSDDIAPILDKYIDEDIYDHIFIGFKTGDSNEKIEIPVNDWIGLGGMQYRNIGFSNIRLPSDSENYIYRYDSRINTFPEEVYLHEFLHTLERNALEFGYERPKLHDNELYGYQNQILIGLREWYRDYLNCEIKASDNTYVGLPVEVFNKKPTKRSCFEYSHELQDFKEPENIIEELNNLFYKIVNMFSTQEELKGIEEEV